MSVLTSSTPVSGESEPSSISLVRRSWRQIDSQAWDDHLAACGSSFLGSAAVLRLRRLSQAITFIEFKLSSLHGLPPTKIAQCAVAQKGRTLIFFDRLHILPDYDEHWSICFAALAREFPVDTYIYGSLWNSECPRFVEPQQHRIKQTPIERSFRMHVIAASRWKSFEEYLYAVSHSIRYEYKKALGSGGLRIEILRGWEALRRLPEIMECRRAVIHKLGERFVDRKSALLEAVRLAGKIMLLGRRSFVASVFKPDGECLSVFVGIEFGSRIYHITGGTKPNRLGAGTLLMVHILWQLFERKHNGQMILGACWGETEVEDYNAGTLLYRRKLRVKAVNGIYEKITIYRTEAASRTNVVLLVYRHLQPWIPFAGLVTSAVSAEL